jgi:hypothetical protein
MLEQAADFAEGTLSAGIAAGAVAAALTAGHGARFTQTRTFTVVIWDSTTYQVATDDPNHEYIKVTAGFGTDAWTIVKGQNGTADVAHNTGGKTYKVAHVPTAKAWNVDLFTVPSFYTGLPGAVPRGIFLANIGTGVVDLYTAPAGKRAIVIISPLIFNTTPSTSISYSTGVKLAGATYQRLTGDQSVGGGNASTVSFSPFVLEPGEIYSITTNATGLNFAATILEFDATFPLFTTRLMGIAVGDNLLYTCPAGKVAVPIGVTPWGGGSMSLVPTLGITYYPEIVPNGQVAGVAFEMASSVPASVNTPVAKVVLALNAGDRYYLNSNAASATSFLFVTTLELPSS